MTRRSVRDHRSERVFIHRHPRESGNPLPLELGEIPAFAGMTVWMEVRSRRADAHPFPGEEGESGRRADR